MSKSSNLLLEGPSSSQTSNTEEQCITDELKEHDDHASVFSSNLHKRQARHLHLVKRQEISVQRLQGVAFFYNSIGNGVPLTFQRFVSQYPALPTIVVFIRILVVPISHVLEEERILCHIIQSLPGFYQATIRFGYMDPIFLKEDFSKGLLIELKSKESDPLFTRELEKAIEREKSPESNMGLRTSMVTHILQNLDVCPSSRRDWSSPLRNAMISFYSFIHSNLREHASYELPTDGLVVVGVRMAI